MIPINHKTAVFLVSFVLIIVIITALLSNFWPKYEMRFFELGVLDKNKTTVEYFEDDSAITTDSQLVWFIYIHNHMGNEQKINVHVKLTNSTTQLPSDRENKPSPALSFVEFPLSLSINETIFVPFSWTILEAEFQNSSVLIKTMKVNNQIIDVDGVGSSSSFYMIFELWVYDPTLQKYNFGWNYEGEFSSASLYVEFNVS